MKQIGIIIGSTDTHIDKVIRKLIGGKYNHCAVQLNIRKPEIWSFTREKENIWFTRCFHKDYINRFSHAEAFIIRVEDYQYRRMVKAIKFFKKRFRMYDYIGAITLGLNIKKTLTCNFTCSTFAALFVNLAGIKLNKHILLYKPMDLYKILYKLSENDYSSVERHIIK